MVLQETWLKAGTIRENICYGKPDATEEEMIMQQKKPMHMDLSSECQMVMIRSLQKVAEISLKTETAPLYCKDHVKPSSNADLR